MIAAALPIAGFVEAEELDAANPFGALPGIELRDHPPDWTAMVRGDRFAVVEVGEQGVLGDEVFQGQIGRPIVVIAVAENEFRPS